MIPAIAIDHDYFGKARALLTTSDMQAFHIEWRFNQLCWSLLSRLIHLLQTEMAGSGRCVELFAYYKVYLPPPFVVNHLLRSWICAGDMDLLPELKNY
jgi:hypothetical protein